MRFLLFVSLIFVTPFAFAERLKLEFGTGVMNCGQPDPRETKKDGTYTCTNHYKPGVPNAKFTIRNGELEGPVYGYTEDGRPDFEGHYRAGVLEGESKRNYSTEKKRFNTVEQFKRGKLHGVKVERNDFNENETVSLYRDGEKEGPTYHLMNGKIQSLSDCKKPCLAKAIPGFEKAWDAFLELQKAEHQTQQSEANQLVERKNKAGLVVERYQLKNNQVFGKHERFFDNGSPYLVSEQTASRKTSEVEFFEDGQIKRKSTYDISTGGRDRELSREEWYQNGKPKLSQKTTFKSDRTNVTEFKEYYDNGKLSEEGRRVFEPGMWSRGVYDGVIKRYSEKGQLEEIETYKIGKREGLTRRTGVTETLQPVIYEETFKDDRMTMRVIIDAKTKQKLRTLTYMPDGSTKTDQTH